MKRAKRGPFPAKECKQLIGIAAGSTLVAIAPPVALLVGTILFFKHAKDSIETGSIESMGKMVMACGDVSGASEACDSSTQNCQHTSKN